MENYFGILEQLQEEERHRKYMLACMARRQDDYRTGQRFRPSRPIKARKRRAAKLTPAIQFIKESTFPYLYGEKTPRGIFPNLGAKQFVGGWNQHLISKTPNWRVQEHFDNTATYYYFGNGNPKDSYTLVMIDIDVDKTQHKGTTKGAKKFIKYLASLPEFAGLYWEPSTAGKGIHGYLLLQKRGWEAKHVNLGIERLEKYLRHLAEEQKADIEIVECKGRCPEISWGVGRNIQEMKYGTFAKMPRCADRVDEWKKTCKIDLKELRSDRYAVSTNRANASRLLRTADCASRSSKVSSGSCSRQLISDAECQAFLPRCEEYFIQWTGGAPLKANHGYVVTGEDFAIACLLMKYFYDHPNPNGSMPTSRFGISERNEDETKGLWQAMYEAGQVSRPWNHHRFKAIRDFLSRHGHIDWSENRYDYGQVGKGKGCACKWNITDEFYFRLCNLTSKTGGDSSWVVVSIDNGKGRFLVPKPYPLIAERERIAAADLWKRYELHENELFEANAA